MRHSQMKRFQMSLGCEAFTSHVPGHKSKTGHTHHRAASGCTWYIASLPVVIGAEVSNGNGSEQVHALSDMHI